MAAGKDVMRGVEEKRREGEGDDDGSKERGISAKGVSLSLSNCPSCVSTLPYTSCMATRIDLPSRHACTSNRLLFSVCLKPNHLTYNVQCTYVRTCMSPVQCIYACRFLHVWWDIVISNEHDTLGVPAFYPPPRNKGRDLCVPL